MIDLQSELIDGNMTIDKVGVKNLRYPIIVKDKQFGSQSTIATINMYVQLPKQYRGTHMSRFIEVINDVGGEKINRNRIRTILLHIKKTLSAKAAHIEVSFPYFIRKEAPVSHSTGLVEYGCRLYGSHDENDQFRLILEVNIMVLNLCPCSRELSTGKSAHNQRSMVTVKLCSGPMVWIEDIVDLVESSASSPIYTVIKRSDEKAIMDRAHDNPRFVEDIVREVASKLDAMSGIYWFSVESENFESIHNHNAYAYIEKGQIDGSVQ